MGLKIERRQTVVHLYTSDDREQIADLARKIEEAAVVEGSPLRVSDENPSAVAAKNYDTFVVKATKRAVAVNLTAMAGKAWRHMLATFPPRDTESHPEDAIGFDVDAMSHPLVLASVDLDQFDNAAQLEEFVDDLSDPDFSCLASAAVRLNTEGGPDPKFSASSWLGLRSAAMLRSEETSA